MLCPTCKGVRSWPLRGAAAYLGCARCGATGYVTLDTDDDICEENTCDGALGTLDGTEDDR